MLTTGFAPLAPVQTVAPSVAAATGASLAEPDEGDSVSAEPDPETVPGRIRSGTPRAIAPPSSHRKRR